MTTLLLLALLCARDRPAAAPVEAPAISGTVAETMDSGGYTYILLKEGQASQWVAAPPMKVKAGQRLTLQGGMVMKDFKSSTLKRVFPSIIFSGGPAAGTESPHGQAPAMAMAHGGKASPLEPGVKVEKAPGPDGVTVAELYGRKKELDGKQVRVRGKVVKVSRAIMDRNWVHLQDGTGDASKGTHDLTVTTLELPEVGEVSVFKGTARKDQDIGMGYRYEVLLEKASRVK